MTDFLTRLVQRTLGLAPVVQPRIASRYAPAAEVMMANDYAFSTPSQIEPASESSTAPEQFATAQTSTESLNVHLSQPLEPANSRLSLTQLEETSPSPSPSSAPLSNPEKNSPLATPEPSQQATFHSSLDAKNSRSVVKTETSFTSSLQTPQHHSENLSSSSQPPFSSAANSSESWVESFSLLPQQSLEGQVAPPNHERFKSQPLSSSSDSRENSSSFAPESLNQPELNSQASSVRLPLVPPAIPNSSSLSLVNVEEVGLESLPVNQQNTIPPEFVSTQPSLASASSPVIGRIAQPEPTIEIRIGRIEVRGIQPAPPKSRPKSTSSAPTLSLSDYLSQRDGGK